MHLDEKGDGGIGGGGHPGTVKLSYQEVAAYWFCWVERRTRKSCSSGMFRDRIARCSGHLAFIFRLSFPLSLTSRLDTTATKTA